MAADLHDVLQGLGAPEDVVAYVKDLRWSSGPSSTAGEEALDRCPRADAAVWIAAARGATLPHLVAAAGACVRLPVDRDPSALAEVTELVDAIDELLEGEGDLDAVVAEAEDLEKRGEQPAGYRDAAHAATTEALRAAAWLARAVEALGVTAARSFYARQQAARYTAALLGTGIASVMPRAEEIGALDPERVQRDPVYGDLPFVVAAAAEAVAHAARSLAAGDESALPAADAECADLFRAAVADLADV